MNGRHSRVTLPILAERIDTSRKVLEERIKVLEERLRYVTRLVGSSAAAILVAVVIAILTRSV